MQLGEHPVTALVEAPAEVEENSDFFPESKSRKQCSYEVKRGKLKERAMREEGLPGSPLSPCLAHITVPQCSPAAAHSCGPVRP